MSNLGGRPIIADRDRSSAGTEPHVTRQRKRLGLGELEAQVMDALWDQEAWLTPAQVHATVGRKRGLAYTTVMTVLVRLYEKGLLERRRAGRAFAYGPVLTREEDAAQRMQDILAAAGNRSAALNTFVASMTPTERAQLRRLLQAR